MRELQSTKAVFLKALQQVQNSKANRIRNVYLSFGEMSGLDQNLIRKHWSDLSKGTQLEHTQIYFRSINAEVQCMACFKRYHPDNGNIHCPHCGSFGAKILSGEEFHFESIETDDE